MLPHLPRQQRRFFVNCGQVVREAFQAAFRLYVRRPSGKGKWESDEVVRLSALGKVLHVQAVGTCWEFAE